MTIAPLIRRFLNPKPVAAVFCDEPSLKINPVVVERVTVVSNVTGSVKSVVLSKIAALVTFSVVNVPVFGVLLPIGGGDANDSDVSGTEM
jgi:hypothetical protein